MQTVTKKSVVERPPSKPATAEMPDIASVQVSDTLAAFQGNPEREPGHAAMRAVTGAGFAVAVTAVIGRLLGLVAVG